MIATPSPRGSRMETTQKSTSQPIIDVMENQATALRKLMMTRRTARQSHAAAASKLWGIARLYSGSRLPANLGQHRIERGIEGSKPYQHRAENEDKAAMLGARSRLQVGERIGPSINKCNVVPLHAIICHRNAP